ncbi:MAG: putative zinc-binding peptidase [Rhodospirillales bacterium]|nr:putative zinc-binding peptidase [Rhodospirillales bacterium]
MRLFRCQNCDQVLYFENVRCERCSSRLGYVPEQGLLHALAEAEGQAWRPLAMRGRAFRFCANAAQDACNWLVPADEAQTFCRACRHNRTVPDLSRPENLPPWRRLEAAKHRLFYALLRLGLPAPSKAEDAEKGLAFDFLADPPAPSGTNVMTGHSNGLITIALAEADDAQREARRVAMGEPYRTLLGHFRHEVGHYFWDRLVRDGGRLDDCRATFGDDTTDYAAALRRHYADGAPANWQERFVSAYAASHPWEDFAETWAHYLHIVDTLETAATFGLRVNPRVDKEGALRAEMNFDPYGAGRCEALIEAWLPLTFAMNSLNRSMGESDVYPFILSPAVIGKIAFIHGLVHPAPGASIRERVTRNADG